MSEKVGARSAVSTRTMEIIAALFLLALGGIVLFDSMRLGAKWADDGPQAGYFPFYIGLFICVCSVVTLAQAVLGRIQGPKDFVSRAALRRVLQVLVPALLYVLGIQLIGIYVASVVYIAGFMIWLGGYSAVRSFLISTTVMAIFYVTFEKWFKVALYKGLFDPIAFLGH